MKSRFFLQGVISMLVLLSPFLAGAATGTTSTGTTTPVDKANTLLLSGVTVNDDMHITMNFTQNIVVESLRIRIAKQSDGTNIKIDSLTGVLDDPKSIYVNLTDLLEAGESYTMTVISALSDKGIAITEGTDALSEFTAPTPLKQSLVVFNAAANPSVTVAETVKPVVESTTVAAENTKKDDIAPPTPENSELPLTGMNSNIFIVISALLALILVTRKRIV